MGTRYLKYPEINKKKWDDCINRSLNGLIYAKTFYLDAMAENWDGIVLNDYEAVMPLTWKKKWGIRYLYQPAFFQQGGIFSSAAIDHSLVQDFLSLASHHFKFAEITLNFGNDPGTFDKGAVTMRNNFVLSLQGTYEDIYPGFSGGTKKNIKRSATRGLKYQYSPHYLPILKLYKELYGGRLPQFVQADYRNFSRLCKKLSEQNNLVVRTVTNSSDELLAAVIILIDRNRLYNMISCVTNEGKKEEANYFLYNELTREFGKSKYKLDFEGSDVKGIADFYNGFTQTNEPYPFIKMNNLHPILKLFKH